MNLRFTSRLLLLAIGVFSAAPTLFAQNGSADQLSLDDMLPKDPAVRTGTLPNGMAFYIRQNAKPEGRAELRLAVRTGSLMEDERQLGLAHFVEHMAFNGTTNFAKNDLVKFLESLGMRFGADLNAYTSFDQTVYMLQVPTEDHKVLEKGLLILSDWSHGITFDGDEIDAERGVVIEEWRARRGGDSRIGEQHLQVQYQGSRYAERLPIGTKENLETFKHETLRKYYTTWYRPDLMAVIAVGDFDPADMEKMIREQFAKVPAVPNGVKRPDYPIPSYPGTRFSIASDPESSNPAVGLLIRHERARRDRVRDYRQVLVDNMVSSMLSQRLDELRQQAEPPFVFAGAGAGLGLGNYRQFSVNARVREGDYLGGFRSVLEEVERVRRHGFTASELERTKNVMLRGIEQYYAERDNTKSDAYAREYVGNFTSGEAYPGIEYEYALYNQFVPTVTLEEVNKVARELTAADNRVVTVGGPENADSPVPTESQLKAVMQEVTSGTVAAYSEEGGMSALMAARPAPGRVVSESTIEELGVTEWTLSNGVRVVLRPTDFKNDEIWISGYSPGGTSLVSDKDFMAASTASSLVARGGVADFDRVTLDKFLSDKVASVSTGIGDLYETVSGSASKEDLETTLQLLYLYFTDPRKDETAMLSYKAQLEGLLETQGTRPEQVFSDTVSWVSTSHHFRTRPFTKEMLSELNLDKSMQIYRERFADADDFRFFFVGSFDLQTIRPLIESYLGSLPSVKGGEEWKDVGIRAPKGQVKKVVKMGVEQKSVVQLVYTGSFDWSMKNRHKLQSMIEVFRMKLRETLREEKGGVYSPGAGASYSQYPKSEYEVVVYFSCDPNRVEELIASVESIAKSLSEDLVDQEYVDKVKEIQRRERETTVKENRFWISSLQFYYQNGEDPRNLLEYGELYKSLTPEVIRDQAKRYFGTDNRMTFILYPED